jgi:hypothetical protein
MDRLKQSRSRRIFRWPGAARSLVRGYLASEAGIEESGQGPRTQTKSLVNRLVEVSGNPRGACWRFARQAGLATKQTHRPWTKAEQQRLLDLIAVHPLHEVTLLLRRSSASVRSMLHRLGVTARMGQDWFTKSTLSEALHVRADEVKKWIDRGWLKCRIVQMGPLNLNQEVIDAEDFCEFCKRHRAAIIGRRLNSDRLSFVQTFVFPPSHMELLPVREAKKEQAAYAALLKKEAESASGEGEPHRAERQSAS